MSKQKKILKLYNTAVISYNNRICRFVHGMLMDPQAAKDVTQEAYLKLWENRENIDFNKVRAWLFTTAYRLSINHIKQRNRYTEEEYLPETSSYPENPDIKEIVRQSLALLPEAQRSIILLRDYEGYSYQEIGQMLSLSETQVKVYLFRGRKKVKDFIGDLRLVF